MDIKEAKMQIAKEFIGKYLEWLNDHNNADLTDREYGRKYGWGKFSEPQKDTQKTLLWFAGHIFQGKYLQQWRQEGIDPFELHRAGFLSYDNCSSWKARNLGKTNFFYISQAKAKEIYKAYKNGFFAEV